MKKTISAEMPLSQDILNIHKVFVDNGFKLYVVGGAVRDFVMGKTPKDFDLVTDAHPDQVENIMNGAGLRTLGTGKSFGVINVFTDDDEFEIATFRSDNGYSDGRRPDSVEFTDIQTDAERRDLTINALYFDIQEKLIIDFVGGLSDIRYNVVRTVGNPEDRFAEDRLRILRCVRMAARMGAKIDHCALGAIKDNPSLKGVSGERIRDEFLKGVASAVSVVDFVKTLSDLGLMPWVFPELGVTNWVIETRKTTVLIATLLVNNSVGDIKKCLNKANYSREEISEICFLVSLVGLNENIAFSLKKRQMAIGVSADDIIEFSQVIWNDYLIVPFLKYVPSISGEDLLREGFSGKQLGDEMDRREENNFSILVDQCAEDSAC